MDFLVATNNINKIKEIEHIVAISECKFSSLDDFNIKSEPKENGKSFLENARIKAYSALDEYKKIKNYSNVNNRCIILADDSGLCVEALGGAPGLYSARYASESNHNASYSNNNEKLLAEMNGIKNRKAYFECCIVALVPLNNGEYKEVFSSGQCRGKIGFSEKGAEGFGYDPLFYPDVFKGLKSMAQISSNEKNRISHRAIALKKLQILLFMC